jgi:hypothetical protein
MFRMNLNDVTDRIFSFKSPLQIHGGMFPDIGSKSFLLLPQTLKDELRIKQICITWDPAFGA